MKRYVKILSALAVMLAVALSVKPAMAYFTTYTEAGGTMKVTLDDRTIIEEPEVVQWEKSIQITNTVGPDSCYVRAKAFGPDKYPITYETIGDGWDRVPDADGWYYYSQPLAKGQSTTIIKAKINNVPEEATEDETFNVIVLYEATPVQYKDGKLIEPKAAEWGLTPDIND